MFSGLGTIFVGWGNRVRARTLACICWLYSGAGAQTNRQPHALARPICIYMPPQGQIVGLIAL